MANTIYMAVAWPERIVRDPNSRVCLNKKFLENTSYESTRKMTEEYKNCFLAPKNTHSPYLGKQIYKFSCLINGHEHEKDLCLTSQQIISIGRSQGYGGLVIQLKKGVCHMCGGQGWCGKTNVGHPVCTRCFNDRDLYAPFPYGRLNGACCLMNGCGARAYPNSDEELAVFRRAINIQTRFERAPEAF